MIAAAGRRVLWGTGAVLLAAHCIGSAVFAKPDGRVVFGDATHHFVQLRSIVFDHDLHFQNEYVQLYGLRGGEPGTEWITEDLTPTGYVRNYMPIGPALLWAPLYVALAGVLAVLGQLGLTSPPDGFERVLQLAPGVTGVVAATLSAVLSWQMARRYTDAGTALVGVLAIWLGSHALYYTLVSPSYSHAASMLTAAVFFHDWTSTRSHPSLGRFARWGTLVGLAALMRWQDAVLIVIPTIEAARWAVGGGRRLLALSAAGAGAAVAFLPQMIVWTVLYGAPLALPQGQGFMAWTAPHLVDVLVSDNHGLFTWAPILIPAGIGLVSFVGHHRSVGWPMVAVVVTTWYVNGAVADWWAGEAFGARRFLSLFPLFAVGLATWLAPTAEGRRSMWKPVVVFGLVAANWLLLLQYQLFMKGLSSLAPYPRGWPDMWVTRFVVPFKVFRMWLW